jgi:hypothetical protein
MAGVIRQLAPPQGDRPPEARQVDELEDGPVLDPRPLNAVRTDRRLGDRLDGDLETAGERLDDLEHVHRREKNQPDSSPRTRSDELIRGTSDSTTSDIANFAGPLLRVWDPHTPLICEAPLCSNR